MRCLWFIIVNVIQNKSYVLVVVFFDFVFYVALFFA